MDNSNVNIDLIRGHVDTIILRSLSIADKYGYEILKEIEDLSNGLFVLKQPTLYSCLKRLEKLNLIESYLGNESNGAQRRYYRLTENGRNMLLQDQYQWEFSRTIINNLLSDKEYDAEKTPPPFNPGDFRPLTRRNMAANTAVNEAAENVQGQPVHNTYNNLENAMAAQSDNVEIKNDTIVNEEAAIEKANIFLTNNVQPQSDENKVTVQEVSNDNTQPAATPIVQSPTVKYTTEPKRVNSDTFNELSQQKEDKINYITTFDDIYANRKDDASEFDVQQEEQSPKVYEDYNYISNMGELKNKLYQDGYKLRPYSRRSTSEFYANNFYYSNKMQRDCSYLCYIIFFIETLIAHFSLAKSYELRLGNMFIVLGVFLLFPILFTAKYFIMPQKKSRTKINYKASLLTASIVLVNAILIICIIGFFLGGAKVGDTHSMMIPILMPLVFLINIPLVLGVYYLLSKSKHYLLK